MSNFQLYKKAISATGTTTENEPIIKSDGDGEVMQWIPSDGVVADGITIDEPGAGNPLQLGIGTISPTVALDVVGAISASGAVILPGAGIIRNNTADAADTGSLQLSSGGAFGATRGAGIDLAGNESGNSGLIQIRAGDGTYGEVRLYSGNSTQVATVSSTGLAVTGQVTASNGIVETNGVLKENLLSNSGFDCWSNSTLCEVTSGAAPVTVGADAALVNNLVSNGGFDSANTGWTDSEWSGGATGSDSNVAGGATGNCMQLTSTAGMRFVYQEVTGLTAGKLYHFSCWGKDGTHTGSVTLGDTFGLQEILGLVEFTTAGGAYFDYTFEATTSSCFIQFVTPDAASDFLIDTVCLYEVTPGCVAADTKGPDGWAKVGSAQLTRMHSDGATEAVTKKGSFYATKIVSAGSPYYEIHHNGWTDPVHLAKYLGRTITFGCWVKTDAADQVKLNIYDGGNRFSDLNTGTGWEWLEVTRTITATDAIRVAGVWVTNTKTAYISQPMLVWGSSIGSGNYSRPMGEIVWLESGINASNKLSGTTQSDVGVTSLNLEADFNGVIPKGAKAVQFYSKCKDSGSAAGESLLMFQADGVAQEMYLNSPYGLANDIPNNITGWQSCNSSGDLQYSIKASGGATGTFDIDKLHVNAIQLR